MMGGLVTRRTPVMSMVPATTRNMPQDSYTPAHKTAQLINNDVTNAQYRLGGQIHGVYKFVGPTYTDFL